MPSIVFLAAVLSLDVTRQLVSIGAGLGYDVDAATATGAGRFTGAARPSTGLPYPSLAITGCTGNGVPVVITTQFPHGVSARGIGGMACIVSGVQGNTAANNVATDPRDRTVGLNQGVLAVPLTPTTLALYGQDSTGRIVALTGNGDYTSGGTVTPALGDGQILIGMGGVKENGAPPRIVMVPRSITPGPRSPSALRGDRAVELASQRSQRNTSTDKIACDFHCWGQKLPSPDAAYDFDAALAITQALKDSRYLLFGATREVSPGTWNDQTVRGVSALKGGELITFSLAMSVPVLDNALPFVPSGTTFESVLQSPTPEIAETIDVIVN